MTLYQGVFRKLVVSLLVLVLITPTNFLNAEELISPEAVENTSTPAEATPPDSIPTPIVTGESLPPPPTDKTLERERVIQKERRNEESRESADSVGGVSKIIDTVPQSLNRGAKTDPASGALIYSYQLDLPNGRNGLTPSLSLTYSSNNRDNDNPLAHGWSFDIPSIGRINRYGSEKLYDREDFTSSLSGELATSTGDSFISKVDEGEFLQYRLTNNAWTVYDKEGTRYLFGTTTATRQDDSLNPGNVYKWMIEEIRDTNGNYIRYEYFKDAGQIYPSRIIYTGHKNTDGIFEIVFNRAACEMSPTMFHAGFLLKTNYCITSVEVKENGQWVRKYEFETINGAGGKRQLLDSITESGRDLVTGSVIERSPTVFSYRPGGEVKWEEDGNTWDLPFHFVEVGAGSSLMQVRDLNGDAYPDVIHYQETSDPDCVDQDTYINDAHGGWFHADCPDEWYPPEYLGIQKAEFQDNGVRLFDYNGDGLTDLVRSYASTSGAHVTDWDVYKNTGSATSTWVPTSVEVPVGFVFAPSTHADNATQVVDVNGDGIADIVHGYIDDDGGPFSENVYLGTGSGWNEASSTEWQLPYGIIDENEAGSEVYTFAQFVDLNGDGLTDVAFKHEDQEVGEKVGINNGYGWTLTTGLPGVWWKLPLPTEGSECLDSSQSDNGIRMMEVNGDGVIDFVHSRKFSSQSGTSDVYINRLLDDDDPSFTLVASDNVPLPFTEGCNVTTDTSIADINADGMDDLLLARKENGQPIDARSFLSRGTPFTDLLINIESSEGASSTIEYTLSTKYYDAEGALLNPNLPIGITTVSAITTNDGFDNLSREEYTYADGFYYFNNPHDRKFAGFGRVEKKDNEGNITKTYFHQGNTTNSAYGEYADHISKAGKPYRVETYDDDENLFSKTINKWDRADLGNGASFVKLIDTVEFSYDGDSDHKERALRFSYNDSTGNLSQKIEYGEVSGSDNGTFSDLGTDKFTTNIAYATSTATSTPPFYHPSKEETLDQGSTKVREKKFYYDTLSFGSLSKGNKTKEEHWKGASNYIDFEKTYNSYGLVTQEKDPRDKITTYSYDTFNLYPATSTNPLTQSTTYLYDYSAGKPRQVTNPNGHIFQTKFDALDRIKEEKQPDHVFPSILVTRTAYVYTDSGMPRAVQKTDYLTSATSTDIYTYIDGLGRVVQERKETEDTNMYAVKDVVYNTLGKVEKESLPYFNAGSAHTSATPTATLYTTYDYDPLQRFTSSVNALGTTTHAYDNWAATTTNAVGNARGYYRDAYENLIRVNEVNSGNIYATTYTWNFNKNLTGITDALENIRSFTYDGLGRRLTATDLHASADGTYGTWTYTYDDAGNVTQVVDPVTQTIVYAYDDLNRAITENNTGRPGTELTYAYDSCTNGIGLLCTAVMLNNATSTYTYNPVGKVVTNTKTINNVSYATGYTYDRQGNTTLINHPHNIQTRYTYNTAGLLEKIEAKENNGAFGNVISDLDYSPLEQTTAIFYANNASTTNTYDATKLYRLSIKRAANASNLKLQNLAYAYDNIGNITRIADASQTDGAKTVDYTYDDLSRLTSASSTRATQNYLRTYTYNALGNMTSASDLGTYVYTGTNYTNPHAVTGVGNGLATTTYTYNTNGNLTSKGVWAYTWDYRNRLTQTGNGTATSTYKYDHENQRVALTDATSTTYFPDQLFAKKGATTTVYIFAGNELVATREGNGIATSTQYVHTDHLGSTNVRTNGSGALIELTDYYPYGSQRLSQTYGMAAERHKYTGHEYDAESDLTYARARYYNQDVGRWLSQDTASRDNPEQFLKDPQQLNYYSYARDNPLIFIDPTGEKVELAAKSLELSPVGIHTFIRITADPSNNNSLQHLGVSSGKIALGAYPRNDWSVFVGSLYKGMNIETDFNVDPSKFVGSITINKPEQYATQAEFEQAILKGYIFLPSNLGAYSWFGGGQVISNNLPSHLLLQSGVPQGEINSIKNTFPTFAGFLKPLAPGVGIGFPSQKINSLLDTLGTLQLQLQGLSDKLKPKK